MEDIVPLLLRGGIVALLLLTAAAAAYLAFSRSKASTAANEFQTMATGIQSAFVDQSDFSDLSNITCQTGSCQQLIQANAVPDNLISNGVLGNDPWGGQITVSSATVPNGAANSGFLIQEANVPNKACTSIFTQASGFDEAQINGTPFYPQSSSLATSSTILTPSTVAAACKAGANTIGLVYGQG